MPVIKLLTKPDNTILNLLIYEGILAVVRYGCTRKFSADEIILDEDAYRCVFRRIDLDKHAKERLASIRLSYIGNDVKNSLPIKILRSLGIDVDDKRRITRYSEMLGLMVEKYNQLVDAGDDELSFRFSAKSSEIIIGKSEEAVTAPQLLKIDRYTGYTSLDMDTTFRQYTLRASKNIILLSHLGVLTSYAGSTITDKTTTHYFLFFSPEEIIGLLASGDQYKVSNIFGLKNKLVERLGRVATYTGFTEILLMEALMDLELYDLMKKYNIEHASFLLYRVVPEGNSYKIYGAEPINLYSDPVFLHVLEKHVSRPDDFIRVLLEALKPGGTILGALGSLNRENKYEEADNVLVAVQNLYRFVSTGDLGGLYGFIREIENAYNITKEKNPGRARSYRELLSRISFFF